MWPLIPLFAILLAGFQACEALSWRRLCAGPALKGEDLQNLRAFVEEQCRPYADRYGFRLVLESAYALQSEAAERHFQGFQEELRAAKKASNTKRLFHGTTGGGARGILSGGFRLPQKGGMFGKGIYFADCPLKSLQYCRGTGPMLLCDVELGFCKTVRTARPDLTPERDFQRSWLKRLVGCQPYDSVMATCCVRVPEYTVYKPAQVVPRFALVVRQVPHT